MSSPSNDQGFTLLETLIALAIFLMAIAALHPAFMRSYWQVNAASQRSVGVSLVVSRIEEELLLQNWAELLAGEKEGTFEDWQWTLKAEILEHETDSETAPGRLIKVAATAVNMKHDRLAPVSMSRIAWVPE